MRKRDRSYRLCWRLLPRKRCEDENEPVYIKELPISMDALTLDPAPDERGQWYTYLEWLEPPIRDENAQRYGKSA